MEDLISRQALCEYALNQKDKSITPNDIMRFPSAQPEPCKDVVKREDVQSIAEKSDWFESSDSFNDFMWALYELPSAQPEPCEDAVSRQAVYNVLDKMPIRGFKKDGETIHGLISLSQVNSAIINLPSAQPETHDKRTETHACDLISRQEAVECDGFREVERDDERRSN